MSEIYDNWERLVGSVLRREHDRWLALLSDSSSTVSSPSPVSETYTNWRRGQVHSMGSTPESGGQVIDLETYQKHVADRFNELAAAYSNELLSNDWLRKLLEVFLCCLEEFRAIMSCHRALLNRSQMERYVVKFFERSVKALDVCNAVREGIEEIRQWLKLLEIVQRSLGNQRSVGEGQFRLAKRALDDLAIGMLDKRESHSGPSHKNRSFVLTRSSREQQQRSLSWSVSRNWSAVRQLQLMSSNLVAPRTNEIASTNGLSLAVFTMEYVLLFVMWTLVAAIPCQDRGLQTHFLVTKQFSWAAPILSLHERILEESKKWDRRDTCGLLKEIHEIEKCGQCMNDLIDSNAHFLMTNDKEKEKELKVRVEEVANLREAIKNGLDPLEHLIREVFHRIVQSRAEGLDSAGRANGHV